MKSKKQVDDNTSRFDEFPDKLTGFLEDLALERKDRSDNLQNLEDAYFEDIKKNAKLGMKL